MMKSAICDNAPPRGGNVPLGARAARQRGRLACTAALACLSLGPATGLLHAIHLAEADHHHHADSCPVCQQLAASTKYVPDSPTEAPAFIESAWSTGTAPSEIRPEDVSPPSIQPRAPPKAFTL